MDYCDLCSDIYQQEVEINQMTKYKLYRGSLVYKLYTTLKQFVFKVFTLVLSDLRYPLYNDIISIDYEYDYHGIYCENLILMKNGFDRMKNNIINHKIKNIKSTINNITKIDEEVLETLSEFNVKNRGYKMSIDPYRILYDNVMNEMVNVYPRYAYSMVIKEYQQKYDEIMHRFLMKKLMKELVFQSEYELISYDQCD